MSVIAIDPGTTQSAVVIMEGESVFAHDILPNEMVLSVLMTQSSRDVLVIEQIASFGMPVGKEVFETVFWSGRFAEAFQGEWHRIPRKQVCMHLCNSARAKDPNIRQALIDRYGGKEAAIGRKAQPGPLYGIKADEWQALGLGVTFSDTYQEVLG